MSNHPLNLALRFLLELAALAALGYWGWREHAGASRWLWAVGAPLAAAFLWGAFRVPGDGGEPLVAVPGIVRLLLEAALFAAAVGALLAADRRGLALVMGAVTLAHYLVSHERVAWLLRGPAA